LAEKVAAKQSIIEQMKEIVDSGQFKKN